MKTMKKLLLILTVALSASCLFSCSLFKTPEAEKFEVVFVEEEDIPAVALGVEYDFEPYFNRESDATYEMSAMYLDDELNEVELDVDGFKFTQNEFSNVFVTITATKDGETVTGEMEIPVDTTYDATDYWVVDSLYAGTGMNKALNYLPAYRTSLDSLTSAKYTYKGTAKKDSPITVMSLMDWPNNSRLTVTDWSNAVITLDVYNVSEKNITMGLVLNHSSGISYTFDQCEKFVCEPNEWTHIEYSLKALNLTEEFVFNHEWDLSDRILIQAVYEDANEEESTSVYSYNFYVDNVDICDYNAEKFPDLDTTTYKEYEDFFTKDDMLSGVVNDDYENKQRAEDLHNTTEVVEYSNKSIKFVLSEDGSNAYGFLHSFIGGTPTGWLPMDITDATMSFYIRTVNADTTFKLRFESDYNIFADPIEIDLTKESGEGWTVTEENGWYKVVIDVDQANVETALVRMDFIRTMRLYFTNTTAQSGSESAIYLETLKLEGWKVTEVYGDADLEWDTKSPYTAAEDNDMFSTDENLVFNINYERQDTLSAADINERMEDSSYSYKLVLSANGENTSNAVVDSFFTGKPSNWTVMDISNATISFGVKNVNADNVFYVSFASDYNASGLILGKKVAIDLSQASGEGWTVEELTNGWKKVTLDIKNANITDEVLGVTKDFIKIMRIEFSNTTAVAESESAIYLDCLNVVGGVATSVVLNEENPWETKSPYVNYIITFENSDGSIISQKTYHYGETVEIPDVPVRENSALEGSFTFTGWSAEVETVTQNTTYKANYEVSLVDLWNGTIENYGLDTLTNDTEVKGENSAYSLHIVEPIESGNLPYFAITLDKSYDLTGKWIVFDYKDIHKEGWLMVFDFISGGEQLHLWEMLSLHSGANNSTYKCEDLGNGWLRVYVNADALSASLNEVSKIYVTLNASDGEGTLDLYFDNLHIGEKPPATKYTITFKDYDGRVISSAEYEEGTTVAVPEDPTRAAIDGECSYVFAGWDYSVTVAECDATYTATYAVASVDDLINGTINEKTIDAVAYDTAVKSGDGTHSLKVTGVWNKEGDQFPYFAITLDQEYDLNNQYVVFDLYKNNYSSWFAVDFVSDGVKIGVWKSVSFNADTNEATHYCEDLGNGWLRVYVDASAMMDGNDLSKVNKLYMTVNNGNEGVTGNLEFYVDNLHFERKPEVVLPTEADDSISGCGLSAVNGGSAALDTSVVSTYSEKSAKFNIPAGNSGVWWNYDVDLTALLEGKGIDLSGKAITFDVKIVGNMTWVGFTVADGNGTYAKVNNEDYVWTNLSDGWSGYGMSIAAIDDGWFRVSFTPDTSFSSASSNIAKLRFLVNPQDANEANMYVDNLYLGELKAYVEPVRTEADDAIGSCGLVAVNGGTMAIDTSVVSTNSEKSVKCTVPAGNSGVWWNYDISLVEANGGAVDLSGKTITFDVKIVGNMSLVGFTVADGNDNYAQPDGEGYVWTNLSDGWGADKGWVVTAMDNGWFRVSFTADTKFSGCSNNIAKLRFLVNPTDGNEASLYIDNLYLN